MIECGDLDRAGARELLAKRAQFDLALESVIGGEDPLAIGLRRGLRIDVQGEELGHPRHGGWIGGQVHVKHLVEVGGRICADQQDPLSAIGERDRHGTG